MSFLESSTHNMSTADIRSASVEKLRAKKRRVRYRNTNMALIGSPVNEAQSYYVDEDQASTHQTCLWNDRNKFKMPPRPFRPNNCRCFECRSALTRRTSNIGKDFSDEACDLNWSDPIDSTYDFKARDPMAGVTYSFDRPTGPSHGSQILSQAIGAAIDKMENKQLEKLVREEYDVIQAEDSSASEEDEEFELI